MALKGQDVKSKLAKCVRIVRNKLGLPPISEYAECQKILAMDEKSDGLRR